MIKKWHSISEVHNHAKRAVNKQVKDLIDAKTLDDYNPKNKGWVGNSIESDWFGLPNNSRKEADFANLNLELKVTPIKKTRNGWSAKERLVLNIFDFNDEHTRFFDRASFLEKADLIELIYYEFTEDTPGPEYFIKAATLFSLRDIPEEDKLIMKQDWELIVGKILEGKAEELSDSLTKYLGATTKGSKSEKNMTSQPFSDTKAHRRSFTLKGSYMTALARKIMSGDFKEPIEHLEKEELLYVAEPSVTYQMLEPVIKDISLLQDKTFEEVLTEQFNRYINKSKAELGRLFDVRIPLKNDKASTRILAKKMLNVESDLEETDEFQKAGIALKVVTVNSNQFTKPAEKRKTTENFKLQNFFNFTEVIKEEWEYSVLYDYLYNTRFLLVVFEKTETATIFKGVKFWSISISDLNGLVNSTWDKTRDILKQGVKLEYQAINSAKGYRINNNLPAESDDTILHVRPDAVVSSYQESSNSMKLPFPANWTNRPTDKLDVLSDYYMTKQAFWLNSSYMYKQIAGFFD